MELAEFGWVLVPVLVTAVVALAFVAVVALVLRFCRWLVRETKDPKSLAYVVPVLDKLVACRPSVALWWIRRRGREKAEQVSTTTPTPAEPE